MTQLHFNDTLMDLICTNVNYTLAAQTDKYNSYIFIRGFDSNNVELFKHYDKNISQTGWPRWFSWLPTDKLNKNQIRFRFDKFNGVNPITAHTAGTLDYIRVYQSPNSGGGTYAGSMSAKFSVGIQGSGADLLVDHVEVIPNTKIILYPITMTLPQVLNVV